MIKQNWNSFALLRILIKKSHIARLALLKRELKAVTVTNIKESLQARKVSH